MKKIFTLFAAALTALSMSAASYGSLVNGKTYFAVKVFNSIWRMCR